VSFDKQYVVGDPEYVRVFATREVAERWLAEIDPRGTIFEYQILGRPIAGHHVEVEEP
jgi:hypothetical protein